MMSVVMVLLHAEPFGGDQVSPNAFALVFSWACAFIKGFIVNLCKNSESRIKQIIFLFFIPNTLLFHILCKYSENLTRFTDVLN